MLHLHRAAGSLPGALLVLAAVPTRAQAVCDPPASLTADSIAYYQAVVRWPAAAGTGTYLVSVQPGNQTYTVAATARRIRLSLSPETTYTVRVARHCTNGLTSAAAQVGFTTPGYCGGPNDVQPTQIGATEATIIFGLAPGSVRDYTVELRAVQPGVGAALVRTYTVTSSPLLLTGLTPATLYDVTFFTNCTNGVISGGTGGAGLPFRTLALATAALAPVAGQLEVYPNPTQGSCTVRLPAPAPAGRLHICLLDAAGRMLYLQPLTSGVQQAVVPLPPVAAGLYLLQVRGAGGYVVSRRLALR
ncbi:T9SS type A sorting domain-containing protein [Hymenobacter metallilatus]|nr:T9SS type A sorting domain-containing protein [Hymenobacter metallilatus]